MFLTDFGITEAKAKQFAKKGIYTVEDLTCYLPRKYNDFTSFSVFEPEEPVCRIILRVEDVVAKEARTPFIMMKGTERTSGAAVTVFWFNQRWIYSKLAACKGTDVFVAGKYTYNEQYNSYQINSPEVFNPDVSAGMAIYPVYSKVPGMSNEYLTEKLTMAMNNPAALAEILPQDILDREGLESMSRALWDLHFPKDMNAVMRGQRRILFNDLVYFALHCELDQKKNSPGSQYHVKTMELASRISESLPYRLTFDQCKALNEMAEQARSGRRIHALLQGDVGCGKTIVAMLLMAAFVGSGYQAVLMAPTQVLARQHYQDAVALFEPLGVRVAYLGGERLKKKERDELLGCIRSGSAQVVIGTHAAFSNDVEYNNLALTVIDEEHKFGVAQREAMVSKAAAGVHSVTMSATPIPRSLAKVVYGDNIQLHTIRTLPGGRKPVMTGIAKSREKIYRFLVKQKGLGHQAYVVCPMIDKNEDMEGVKSVEEVSAEYRAALEPHGLKIATLTGRDGKEQTEETIRAFRDGEIDVLIATTVIEVGVNVPNSTTMIITNADRFGLSGLHQLRGRVGRGDAQSYCVLESAATEGKAKERLDVMCETTDGFKIAEADLRIRGAGDFIGTKQSGDNKYMSLMLAYPERYERARVAAKALLERGSDCCELVRRVVAERMQAATG